MDILGDRTIELADGDCAVVVRKGAAAGGVTEFFARYEDLPAPEAMTALMMVMLYHPLALRARHDIIQLIKKEYALKEYALIEEETLN